MATAKKESKSKSTTKKSTEIKKKEEPKKDQFSFGGVSKKMTKEERDAIIEEALAPSRKTPVSSFKWTVEETEYEPKEWVVVLTPNGMIYQEPVPRYWNYQNFVNLLSAIPDNPVNNNKIDFDAELYKTSFEVKGVDCYINTVSTNGTRQNNEYAKAFTVLNGTAKVGGNLVFSGGEKGFTRKQCKSVVEQIIKKLESYEEKVEFK